MKDKTLVNSHLRLPGILTLLLFIALSSMILPSSALASEKSALKWTTTAEVESTYSSNIFNLSKAQQNGLETNNANAQTSGRYSDMEHVTDIVVSPAMKLNLKSSTLSSGQLKLQGGVTYNQYLLNTKKSYSEFDFNAKQDLGSSGSIGFEFTYKLDVFKKNYLSDAIDGDASLNITPDERVYTAGNYNSALWDVTYSHSLFKAKKNSTGNAGIKKITGNILAGMENITFDDPFSNRDSDTTRLGAGFDIELESKTNLALSYLYESIDVTVASEVLLRNEPDFGVDLNGDADSLDLDVRTVQTVNRSRTDHSFKVKATKKLQKRWVGHASYALRIQNYDSNETYDVTRVDRKDTRHTFGLGLDRSYGKKLSMELDWKYYTEDANRAGLGAIGQAESKPYNKHLLSLVLAYKI